MLSLLTNIVTFPLPLLSLKYSYFLKDLIATFVLVAIHIALYTQAVTPLPILFTARYFL